MHTGMCMLWFNFFFGGAGRGGGGGVKFFKPVSFFSPMCSGHYHNPKQKEKINKNQTGVKIF